MRTDGALANILEIGTIPKTILTDKLTLSEDEMNDSNAIREVTDFHVWCVDERKTYTIIQSNKLRVSIGPIESSDAHLI